MNNKAIRFLDIEFILAPRMPAKGFSKLTKLLDTVERATNGLVTDPSMEVQGLMRRTSSAIAAFIRAHPDLLAHARANAQSAPSIVRPIRRFQWGGRAPHSKSWWGRGQSPCPSLVQSHATLFAATRDLPEWEPLVGHRWLALARMQQTGEYPMPPSV